MTKRRAKATQITPSGPPVMFEILDAASKRTEWHIVITDAILNDRPEFVVPIGPKRAPYTLDDVCRAGARECNENVGMLTVTEWRAGAPTFSAIVAVARDFGGRIRYRVPWSTDAARCVRELPGAFVSTRGREDGVGVAGYVELRARINGAKAT